MNNSIKNLYTISNSCPTVFWLKFKERNRKGELLVFSLTKCTTSLPYLWYKKGYIDRVLNSYWSVETYIKDSEGNTYGRYNPQIKISEDDKGSVINFDWMLEATEENMDKIICEVYKLFSNAVGKSATEEKLLKILEYAEANNIKIVSELPKGWIKLNYSTDPAGCVSIGNVKPTRRALKEGIFIRMLLLC